jgi:hypothetical protein
VSDEPPAAVVDTPAEAPAYVDQAPAAQQEIPPAAAPPVDPALAPPVTDPALVAPQVPPAAGPMDPDYNSSQVPTKKPGIWTRIKEKLTPGPG